MISIDDYQEYVKYCKMLNVQPQSIISDFYNHLEKVLKPMNALIETKRKRN